MRRALLVILAAAAACDIVAAQTPGPASAPVSWTQAPPQAGLSAMVDAWWREFKDPILTKIVLAAEQSNRIDVAAARLDAAAAGLRQARAILRPQVSAFGSVGAQQAGDDPDRQNTNRAGLDLSYALDPFGADRARRAAAKARLEAAQADAIFVRIETRAAAVRLYLALREAQAQRAAADRTLRSLTETLEIVSIRSKAGLAPELDLAQARAALEAARARPPSLMRVEVQSRLALEALLGQNPGALELELASKSDQLAAIPAADFALAAKAPALVLADRPDLKAAERAAAAAGFDSVAARRDFWPKLSFSALIGGQSVSPGNPFSGDGAVLDAAAALAAPLFSFGRLEAARDGADARKAEALSLYRDQMFQALAEVEQTFIAGRTAQARGDALKASLEAAKDQARLARARYVAGLSPLLEVLAAERATDEAEGQLAAAKADLARAFVDLAAALGMDGKTA